MIFKTDSSTVTGSTTFTAEPLSLDATPIVGKFIVDSSDITASPDRKALALLLAFHASVSGIQHFESDISPLLMTHAQDLIQDRSIYPRPIHKNNLPIARGTENVLIAQGDSATSTVADGDRSAPFAPTRTLQILQRGRFQGFLSSADTVSVSSNAWMFQSSETSTIKHWMPMLAVAVLLADSLNANLFIIPDVEQDELFDSLATAMNSVGLGLLSR